jgi:hypothetical protein
VCAGWSSRVRSSSRAGLPLRSLFRRRDRRDGLPRQVPQDFAPLDVWDPSFAQIAQSHGISLAEVSAEHAELSEAAAALFVFQLLWRNEQLRSDFQQSIVEPGGRFCEWITGAGGTDLGFSEMGRMMVRRMFHRRYGEAIYHTYLNNPELQAIYRLGLLPAGQAHFLGWLATHGRSDHGATDEHVLWFLVRSREDLRRGLVLTYLLRPDWQQQFPQALTKAGWPAFRRSISNAYGSLAAADSGDSPPPAVLATPASMRESTPPSRWMRRNRICGVNVISHFCNPSGIQQAALWTKAALERAGMRTSCRDVPVPRRTYPVNREEWLGLETFPVTVLTHAGTPYFTSAYERSGLHRREGVYRIAYWAWELERVPSDWSAAAAQVDEIWSPTPFVAQAMRSAISLPVHEMLPGVEVGPVQKVGRDEFGIPESHCLFLFMFDLHSQLHRKNPEGVIGAFTKAFRAGDEASLVIKVSGGDIHSSDLAMLETICRVENVLLVHELMSRERAYGMVEMCDCFVSLHRSEGFGLGMAEAMLLGKPVIATGYSGNLAFMNRENSLLVDYNMVEIAEDRPIYTRGNHWAEPSVEHAASLMRHVYENRDEATARARTAQPQIKDLLSIAAAGRRMRRRLEQIASDRSRL